MGQERNITSKARTECAKALAYFLKLGWPKSSLDALEELWWQVRDDNGNVRVPDEEKLTHA
jgi:hypothetical protein